MDQAKEKITALIERYLEVLRKGEEDKFSEPNVRLHFIEPFLDALGWRIIGGIDVVEAEQTTLTGPVDFALKVNGKTKIVFEIKKFSEDLDGYRISRRGKESYAEQSLRYAYHKNTDWAVLTNFKEIRIYNARWDVKTIKERILHPFPLTYNDYLSNFDKIWLLSRESVISGQLDTWIKKGLREPIDRKILRDLLYCRIILTKDIINNNKEITKEELMECVQKILDRFVVIRTSEDRDIIPSDSLWLTLDTWKKTRIDDKALFIKNLIDFFRQFDAVYNSKLFEEHKCEELVLNNDVIEQIINMIYEYNFDIIGADVLGSIYEDYIGHILEEKEELLDIVENYDIRRKEGIYYTPIDIVDYIINNTIGSIIKTENNIKNVSNIKIVDPACGSGSFLIKCFDVINIHYNNYNKQIMEKLRKSKNKIFSIHDFGDFYTFTKKQILTQNLFGVDLDLQATEIASVNLMLKALSKGERLPLILGENVKIGNSLVDDKNYDDLAFSWKTEFSDVMNQGGFNVVIGNPPWGADLSVYKDYLESNYDLAKGQYDSYELFIELSKRVLREGGCFGFVIPDSIFYPEHEQLREFLATQTQIEHIIKLGEGFFEGVFRSCVILIFKKHEPAVNHKVLCAILMKEDRKKILSGESDLDSLVKEKAILIPQKRFQENNEYAFDISRSVEDDEIMKRMEDNIIEWEIFSDSARGVEFSQSGIVLQCPNCFKWDVPPAKRKGKYKTKKCKHCNFEYEFEEALKTDNIVQDDKVNDNYAPFITGESVNRYYIKELKYLDINKDGINYKNLELYSSPKLMVRKTGVGIYATIDYNNSYVPQVVYFFKLKEKLPENLKQLKLEYILGLINSRLMLFYYYKKFGELEWKSFPYVTQKTIMQLPIKKIDFNDEKQKRLHDGISKAVNELINKSEDGNVDEKIDYEIEDMVMQLYDIEPKMKSHIWNEFKKFQRLRIIREIIG